MQSGSCSQSQNSLTHSLQHASRDLDTHVTSSSGVCPDVFSDADCAPLSSRSRTSSLLPYPQA